MGRVKVKRKERREKRKGKRSVTHLLIFRSHYIGIIAEVKKSTA